MTTVQLTLNIPDSLAQAANNAGLLKPAAIETLLRQAVRHQAVDELFAAADKLLGSETPAMTLEEIQEEVNAVRAARNTHTIK